MRRHFLAGAAVSALLSSFLVTPAPLAQAQTSIIARVATGQIKAPVINVGNGVHRTLPTFSGGLVTSARELVKTQPRFQAQAPPVPQTSQPMPQSLGCRNRNFNGNVPANIRVNQDCTYRRQAEETIAYNPTNPQNLIAGQNDSRIGYNHCGFDYTLNGGQSWGDGQPPFWTRTNNPTPPHTIAGGTGTGHTYDAASDPAVAFDASGNAYYSCVVFDINDNASGLLVTQSPSYAHGSFYNNVPDSPDTQYVVDEETTLAASPDKEFIAADNYQSSPYRNNVYVTWTSFTFDPRCGGTPDNPGYCSGAIFFSKSTDGAKTWSAPVEISGSNPNLCFFGNGFDPNRSPSTCDFDQGSDPVILPNGNIVVTFNNGNTPAGNPNSQQLAVVSTDGGNTFSSPVLVGHDYTVGEPQCDVGRGPEECVPGNFIRNDDFPLTAVDRSNGTLYSVWNDYRTGKYGIVTSQSTDGGLTWTESTAPIPNDGRDDYQAAVGVSPLSHAAAISYYRTDRVPNENCNGFPPPGTTAPCVFDPSMPGVQASSSDYALGYGHGINAPYTIQRVALPFPPPDGFDSNHGGQYGFLGDYSGITVISNQAYPIWSDTRNVAPPGQVDPTLPGHDEDVFTQSIPIH